MGRLSSFGHVLPQVGVVDDGVLHHPDLVANEPHLPPVPEGQPRPPGDRRLPQARQYQTGRELLARLPRAPGQPASVGPRRPLRHDRVGDGAPRAPYRLHRSVHRDRDDVRAQRCRHGLHASPRSLRLPQDSRKAGHRVALRCADRVQHGAGHAKSEPAGRGQPRHHAAPPRQPLPYQASRPTSATARGSSFASPLPRDKSSAGCTTARRSHACALVS